MQRFKFLWGIVFLLLMVTVVHAQINSVTVDFESNSGWVAVGTGPGAFEIGVPSTFPDDPFSGDCVADCFGTGISTDHSSIGVTAACTNLDGHLASDESELTNSLTSPIYDFTNKSNIELTLWNFVELEGNGFDMCYYQFKNSELGAWQTFKSYGDSLVEDNAWRSYSIDLSTFAANKNFFQMRFYCSSDSFVQSGGLCIDDITLSWVGEGPAVCGNGILETGEQCDDGNVMNSDGCKNDCTTNICGDGIVYVGVEQCDDGNPLSGDGCSTQCSLEEVEVIVVPYIADIDSSVGADWYYFYDQVMQWHTDNGVPAGSSIFISTMNDVPFNTIIGHLYSNPLFEPILKSEAEINGTPIELMNQSEVASVFAQLQQKYITELGFLNYSNVQSPTTYNQELGKFTETIRDALRSLGFNMYFEQYVSEYGNIAPLSDFDVTQYAVTFTESGLPGPNETFKQKNAILGELLNKTDSHLLTVNGIKVVPLMAHQQDFRTSENESVINQNKWNIYTETLLAAKVDPRILFLLPEEIYALRHPSISNSTNITLSSHFSTFESDTGWIPGGIGQSAFEIGVPQSFNQLTGSCTGACLGTGTNQDHTPNGVNAACTNLDGYVASYANDQTNSLVSPVYNFSKSNFITLQLWRFMEIEGDNFDFCYYQYKDSPLGNWVSFETYGQSLIDDSTWQPYSRDVSTFAANKSFFQMRFYCSTDNWYEGSGLCLDDINVSWVTAVAPPVVCGNGILETGEQCDDGNVVNGDGCSSVCVLEVANICGDGVLNASSEQCDDGNVVNGDGCSSVCAIELVNQTQDSFSFIDFESENSWSARGTGRSSFEIGVPGPFSAGGECSGSCFGTGPNGDHTPIGTNAACTNVDGFMSPLESEATNGLYSPVYDFSGKSNIQLNLWQFMETEGNNFDFCYYQYKDSPLGNWVSFETYGQSLIDDSTWQPYSRDVSTFAANKSFFQMRFYCSTDNWYEGSGLCLDDINVSWTGVGIVPMCGDGIKEGNEECDDGNINNNDECTNQCIQENVVICDWKDCKSGAASVSIDDGSFACRDILNQNGIRGTYYLSGTESYSASTWNAWKAVALEGHELGGHTRSHACQFLSENELRNQIETNKDDILQNTGLGPDDVSTFAWPCGVNNELMKNVAQDYYFLVRGYHLNKLENNVPLDFMNVKSLNTPNFHPGLLEPPNYVDMLDKAEKEQHWANLVFHNTCNEVDVINSLPGRDLWVDPIVDVGKYIVERENSSITNFERTASHISFTVLSNFNESFYNQEISVRIFDIGGAIIGDVLVDSVSSAFALHNNSIVITFVPKGNVNVFVSLNGSVSTCGNNITEAGEQCDDGNVVNGDGCSSVCVLEVANICGDGVLNASSEQCDDGNVVNTDTCKNDCTANICGDGAVHVGVEQCDDGNVVNGDGCNSTCTFEVVQHLCQYAESAVSNSEQPTYLASYATGAPNADGECGTSIGGVSWAPTHWSVAAELNLTFATPVFATNLTIFGDQGMTWESMWAYNADTNQWIQIGGFSEACVHTQNFTNPLPFKTTKVRLLKTTQGWSATDAVQLCGVT
jgi:cysteine-rich repeat protein